MCPAVTSVCPNAVLPQSAHFQSVSFVHFSLLLDKVGPWAHSCGKQLTPGWPSASQRPHSDLQSPRCNYLSLTGCWGGTRCGSQVLARLHSGACGLAGSTLGGKCVRMGDASADNQKLRSQLGKSHAGRGLSVHRPEAAGNLACRAWRRPVWLEQ